MMLVTTVLIDVDSDFGAPLGSFSSRTRTQSAAADGTRTRTRNALG